MTTLVLLRHGESTWNRENRFTGWTDVDLSERGLAEAAEAGRLLRDGGYVVDFAYTSVLKRAIRTLFIALDALDRLWIPVEKDWRLNERHYGALQGLNKAETAAQLRHAPAGAQGGRSARPAGRPPLRRPETVGNPALGIAEEHDRPRPSVLAGAHRPGREGRPARPHRGARKLAARAHQGPRQHP